MPDRTLAEILEGLGRKELDEFSASLEKIVGLLHETVSEIEKLETLLTDIDRRKRRALGSE